MDKQIRAYLSGDLGILAGIAALVFTLIFAAVKLGWFEPLELIAYDRLMDALPPQAPEDSPVVYVAYTGHDIADLGFPLSDTQLAAALEMILAQGPRAVGVDFYRDVPVGTGTDRLHDVIAGDDRAVMIYRFATEAEPPIYPPPVLRGTDQTGFSDLMMDRDETVRRAILYQGDEIFGQGFSLALRIALLYLREDGVGLSADPDDPESIRIGQTTIPRFRGDDGGYSASDEAGYQLLVDFRGGRRGGADFPIGEVIKGNVPADAFRDRIVLVGSTAESHSDDKRVPISYGDQGRWWQGIWVHGQIVDQLVRYGLGTGEPLRAWSAPGEAAWLLVWVLLGALGGVPRLPRLAFLGVVLLGGLGLLGAVYLAAGRGLWLPVAAPGLGWLMAGFGTAAIVSRRERQQFEVMSDLLSRHLSPTYARVLWEQRSEFMDGNRPRPQRLIATVLFADVKGSTGMAERLGPLGAMEWLNDFMQAMAREAGLAGGLVDDYFGDGLKADFGVPIPRQAEAEIDADAVAAVHCALGMGRALLGLNRHWEQQGRPLGGMRVGIATGPVVAGSVGDANRLKYTLVGDTVNMAARIESLDDTDHDFARNPCRILVGEGTLQRLGDGFDVRDRGEQVLRGRDKSVRVFEVLGQRNQEEPQI